jgi:hypothetical protein
MLCYVMLCYVMLCYVMLCYVMLCYVMLCYVMLCYVCLLKFVNIMSVAVCCLCRPQMAVCLVSIVYKLSNYFFFKFSYKQLVKRTQLMFHFILYYLHKRSAIF